MIPTWMIDEIERRRREREHRELPPLRIELPRPPSFDEGARHRRAPSGLVVIDLCGEPDRRAPSEPMVVEYASPTR